MDACYKSGDFGRYYRENMSDLGLPVPSGWFDTFGGALTGLTTLVSTFKALGAGATMAEIVGATFFLEKLGVAGSMGASWYIGASVGSAAVAAGRSGACGTTIAESVEGFLAVIEKNPGLQFPGWRLHYSRHREILQPHFKARRGYARRMASESLRAYA